MGIFENKNIQKEYSRNRKRFAFSLFMIILSFWFSIRANVTKTQEDKEMMDFLSIVTTEKTNKKAYLNVKSEPYKFAFQEGDNNGCYYFATDGSRLYVIYMDDSDYQKLKDAKNSANGIHVEGITHAAPDEIKKIAVDVINDSVDDNQKITLNDYDYYLGSVYLDLTEDVSMVVGFQNILFYCSFGIGIVSLLIVFIRIKILNNFVQIVENVNELGCEINDKDAIYYDKLRLYLTKNYMVSLTGMPFIKYEDIIWMYQCVQRVYGISVIREIIVLTNDGKNYTLARTGLFKRIKKTTFDEIVYIIITKNDQIRLGYTDEYRKEMKQIVKEIKKERKMKI